MSEWQTVKQYADSKKVTPQYVYKLKRANSPKHEFKQEEVSRMWLVREIA